MLEFLKSKSWLKSLFEAQVDCKFSAQQIKEL